jgi:hypothetical protein
LGGFLTGGAGERTKTLGVTIPPVLLLPADRVIA